MTYDDHNMIIIDLSISSINCIMCQKKKYHASFLKHFPTISPTETEMRVNQIVWLE